MRPKTVNVFPRPISCHQYVNVSESTDKWNVKKSYVSKNATTCWTWLVSYFAGNNISVSSESCKWPKIEVDYD